MKQEFYVGQLFEGTYPPKAAFWCNRNSAKIIKLEDKKYQIVSSDYQESVAAEEQIKKSEEIKEKIPQKRARKKKSTKTSK